MLTFKIWKYLTGTFISLFILIPTGLAQKVGTIDFQPTKFTASSGEVVDCETGWINVPELHSNLKSPTTIKLPVIRFKSTSLNPGHPIIYLAGGPGASGLDSAKEAIFPLLMALRQRADVIVFDQRGTGIAEPSLKISEKIMMPLDTALDEEVSRRYLSAKAKSISDEIAKRGINLSAYNTAENADDVEDLRKALGAEKITVWGHSYGTHLALAFIKRHPKNVHQAILGSINGLEQRWRLPSNLDDLIDRIDSYINLYPKLKRQIPSLRQSVATVFLRLEKNPVVVSLQGKPMKIGKLELQTLVAIRSGDLEFVKMLPMLFGQMEKGDYSFVAPMIVGAVKQRELGTAMQFSMHIASGVSSERLNEIEKLEITSLFGRGMNFPYNEKDFLSALNIKDLGSDFRKSIISEVPTLFLSATMDGRTSLPDAVLVRQRFPTSQLVVIEGASHDFYHLSSQILVAMQDFLDGKKVVERINTPFDLRSVDERQIVMEVRKTISEKGVETGVKKLRDWTSPNSEKFISSYVFGNLGTILMRDDKKMKEALEIFRLGTEVFPDNLFLSVKLAEAFEANGMKSEAIAQYEKSLKLNPLNRRPAVKIAELTKAN